MVLLPNAIPFQLDGTLNNRYKQSDITTPSCQMGDARKWRTIELILGNSKKFRGNTLLEDPRTCWLLPSHSNCMRVDVIGKSRVLSQLQAVRWMCARNWRIGEQILGNSEKFRGNALVEAAMDLFTTAIPFQLYGTLNKRYKQSTVTTPSWLLDGCVQESVGLQSCFGEILRSSEETSQQRSSWSS